MSLPFSEGHPVESKVQATAVAGAITIVVVWIASLFGLEVPPFVASAFTTIIVAVAAYFAPHTPRVYEPSLRERV